MKTFLGTSTGEGFDLGEHNRYYFKKWLKENVGGVVKIICGGKARVSDTLRGYYYGSVMPLLRRVEPQWQDAEDDALHNLLKLEFNGVEIYSPFEKKKIKVSGSVMSKEASTHDAMLYIERIGNWLLNNYGEQLPDAEEYKKLRDRHFDTEPIPEIEYPENTLSEPNF